MSRPARILSSTGMYHIFFRGMSRQDIFEENYDYKKLTEIIIKVKNEFKFELYAYCLMPNHVHMFIKEKESGDIKRIMHKILSTYVGWFNFKYERSGSLIANRYKSEPVEDEKYYLSLLRYIHQNPLKAGLVTNLKEYTWSSYNSYINDKEDFVNKSFALEILNENKKIALKEFEEFHKLFDNEEYEISEKIKLTDDQIRRKFRTILKIDDLTTIRSMPKNVRNELIVKLRQAGYSIRVIERITGISRGVIERAGGIL